jgi:hypothetical protein
MPAPLSDAAIIAVSRLVDDAQGERRDPSHADLEFRIDQAGLSAADPNRQGQVVGKARRTRATLQWALEHSSESGERLVEALIPHVRGCGGFRSAPPRAARRSGSRLASPIPAGCAIAQRCAPSWATSSAGAWTRNRRAPL